MELIYLGLSSSLLFLLGIIWSKVGWINISVKISLILTSLLGIVLILEQYGFIIKK